MPNDTREDLFWYVVLLVTLLIMAFVTLSGCSGLPKGRGSAETRTVVTRSEYPSLAEAEREVARLQAQYGEGAFKRLIKAMEHAVKTPLVIETRTTESRAKTPPGGESPATADSSPGSASSGTGYQPDFAVSGLNSWTGWIGAALVLAGVGSVVARVWFGLGVLSITGSLVLIGSGIGVWALPMFLDRALQPWAIWIAVAVGAGALVLHLNGTFDNWRRAKQEAN